MDSRPLLKTNKIRVFVDSNTFHELAKQNNREAIAILRHNGSELLDFVRNPFESDLEELKSIAAYRFEMNAEQKGGVIELKRGEYAERNAFWYKKEDILSTAKAVYGKEKITEDEFARVLAVFIQASFSKFEKSNIYITNDDLLLKKRLWFESHFPGCALNIMSVAEASLFLDLFFKKNGQYLASHGYILNKGYWYLLSLRLRLPRYNGGDEMSSALATRMSYALMALDEIGIQYYNGVNNDTMDNTLYHFNYLITLFTGIFDNLALMTNTKLGIGFVDKRRISLSHGSGREFLKKIREKNLPIREHINSYVDFINLIYLFREKVIHQEGLTKTGFESRSADGVWYANFIKISKEVQQRVKACGDKASPYDPFTEWGSYQLYNEDYLNPYSFSTAAMRKLIEFVDKYMELLGCPSYLEEIKKMNDDFTKTLAFFEKYHLGF